MPGTISFDGLATGINTTETVDKLIEVESRPKILKEAGKARLENQLATWQEINTKLLDLRTQAQDLWKSSTWGTISSSSSSDNLLTASTTSSAKAGTYTFEVTQAAHNHQLASQGYASELSDVGTGTLTITVGDPAEPDTQVTHEITIDSSNNTLSGVASALNQADIGVTASVINDGTGNGYRLLLVADDTGEANQFAVSPSGVSLNVATVLQQARDSQIQFGSGAGAIAITSASNEVEGVIEGVTLNVLAQSPGTSVTLSLTRDTAAVEEKIEAFVEKYNAAISYIGEQFEFDSETNSGGILMGDRSLLAIQSQLQRLIVNPVVTGGTYNSLGGLGLKLESGGLLAFDKTAFAEAVGADYEAVEAMFRTTGRTDHAKVSFVYAGQNALEPPTDGYELIITTAAERADLVAAQDIGSLTIDGTNDTLTLSIDDESTFDVVLDQRTYGSSAELATALQTKINAANEDKGRVTVSAESNRLTVASLRYGSASEVHLFGGNALANLGFAANDQVAGVDVAGTINDEQATGNGQLLVGDDDNPNTDGVQLQIDLTPDDLTAAGGTVESKLYFAKGVGARLNEYLQNLTTPLVGRIGMKETALENSITSISERIEEMEERLEQRRESLLKQFYRMEKAVNQFNSQGNYLINALSGLNNNWNWNT